MPIPAAVHALKETVRHALDGSARHLPERARDLPGLAVRTAVTGLEYALTVTDRVRRQYAQVRQDGVGHAVDRLRRDAASLLGSRDATAGPAPAGAVAEESAATEEPAVGGTRGEAFDGTAARRVPRQDELPVDDYERLSMESLRARLRTFTVSDLTLLRDYERAHANRQNIVTMFENRIAKLRRQA